MPWGFDLAGRLLDDLDLLGLAVELQSALFFRLESQLLPPALSCISPSAYAGHPAVPADGAWRCVLERLSDGLFQLTNN